MLPTEPPKATYPTDRKSCGHAIRFIKSLFASQAAAKAGPNGLLLAIFVAATEDRIHYKRPPQIRQTQLMKELGLTSPKKLVAARQQAIEAGILHYVKGNRFFGGTYWTLVPDWLEPFYSKNSNGGILDQSPKFPNDLLEASQNSNGGILERRQNSRGGTPSSSYPLKSITPSLPTGEKPVGGVEEMDGEEESQGPLRYGLDQPDEVFA